MFVQAFSLYDRKSSRLAIRRWSARPAPPMASAFQLEQRQLRRPRPATDSDAFGSTDEFPGGFRGNANREKHAVSRVRKKAASILIFKTSRFSVRLIFKLVRVDASKNFSSSRGLLRTCGRKPGAGRRRRQRD